MRYDSYQIWIEHDGRRDLLPMNPPKITIKLSGDNKSVNVADLGEAIIPRLPKAKEISFSSFFPKRYISGMKYPPHSRVDPKYFVTLFFQLMNEKTVVRLCITGCGFFWNCVVDDFTCSESGGDVGTFDYSVKFREYKPVQLRKIDTGKVTNTPARVNTKQVPQTYTVKAGDSLWAIAKKLYGDGAKFTIIRDANKELIAKHGGNPNMIWPGDVLKIPKQ